MTVKRSPNLVGAAQRSAVLAVWLCVAMATACGESPGPTIDDGLTDGGPRADAAAPDATLSPLAHCSPEMALPAWATTNGPGAVDARCGLFGLGVEALDDGIVRLRYTVSGQDANTGPSWAVAEAPAPASLARVTGHDGDVEVCTEAVVVRVKATTCAVTAHDADGQLLLSDVDTGAFTASSTTMSIARHTPAGESFYGFGEKTGSLDKRGVRMEFWNTDAYDPALGGFKLDQDPLYLSIPFFIGLRDSTAYGLFTDSPARVEMDMAATATDRYEITVHDAAIDQYLVVGPRMSEVVRRYTGLTGRMKLPPRWALGYHQSRWGYESAARIDELSLRFRSEDIPADALWLDIQHLDEYRTFTWDAASFPDPAALVQRLADRGFKVVAIADPGIKVDPDWSVYSSGVTGGHFLRTAAGDIYEGTAWPGASSFPDFTRPATRAWWAAHVQDALGVGLRGIWLDVNEPTIFPEAGGEVSFPTAVPVDNNGAPSTMARVHNAYANGEASATYDGMLAAAPDRRPFILSRAGYAGIQRHAAVWTGDVVSDWNGLAGSLPMLLNMGLSGVSFVGSDVGGYSGHATPELFARWMSVGMISPFFRGHVTSNVPGQEPWEFGTEVRDISRSLIRERYRLLPYIYSLMRASTRTGEPALRPMIYEAQDDPSMRSVGDQAMLGPFLLAAPVVEQGAITRKVKLPAGRWFDYYSGAIYDGPTEIDVLVTLAALPLFVREGAIIPRGPVVPHADAVSEEPLTLELYPGSTESSFTVYRDAGDGHGYRTADEFSEVTYTLVGTDTGARVRASARAGSYVPADRRLLLRLRRVDGNATGVRNGGVALTEHPSLAALQASGEGWWLDVADRSMVIAVKDDADFELDLAYAPAIIEPRPPVDLVVEVTVPEGTPTDTPLYIATSANGWTQQPLTWTTTPNVARGVVSVPRGEWFHYKYTRGDWDTVEKWPNCEEASNRYRLGTATRSQHDTVFGWADWCP